METWADKAVMITGGAGFIGAHLAQRLVAEHCDEPALINLSTGDETSIREVVDLLTELTGFAGEVEWDTSRPDGQARRVFDVSKAEKHLGFRAQTTLGDGLKHTVDWYRANRHVARNVASSIAGA